MAEDSRSGTTATTTIITITTTGSGSRSNTHQGRRAEQHVRSSGLFVSRPSGPPRRLANRASLAGTGVPSPTQPTRREPTQPDRREPTQPDRTEPDRTEPDRTEPSRSHRPAANRTETRSDRT